MKQFDPKQLGFFTGTTAYHLHAPLVLLTDGAKYVAEHAEAYWLMDAITGYLLELANLEHFFCITYSHGSIGAAMDKR